MDAFSVSIAAVQLATMCAVVVRQIKSIVEAMKKTKQALLDLLSQAERLRLILELLRSLATQLQHSAQRATMLTFNESACRETIEKLQMFVNRIITAGSSSNLWMAINWLYYKPEAVALVEKLQRQEQDIVLVVNFVTGQSSLNTEHHLRELQHRIPLNQVIHTFSTLTIVNDKDDDEVTLTDSPRPSTGPVWFGYALTQGFQSEYVRQRNELSTAAYSADWATLWRRLQLGTEHFNEVWINAVRLKKLAEAQYTSFWTPLHQAAFNCAPARVVEKMLRLGALRTLRTRWAEDEFPYRNMTALEIARALGHSHLYQLLSPVIRHPIPADTLMTLQHRLHDIIKSELMGADILKFLYLPDLNALTELEDPEMSFPLVIASRRACYRYRLDGRELLLSSNSVQSERFIQLYRISEHGVLRINQAVVLKT